MTSALPPEIWAQVYSSVVDYADYYRELKPYLFICRLSYSSIYPRLFETLVVNMASLLEFDKWKIGRLTAPDSDPLLKSRLKRVYLYNWDDGRRTLSVNIVTTIFKRYSSSIERFAYYPIQQHSWTKLFIASTIPSLVNLRFLEVSKSTLTYIVRESKAALSLALLDTLSLGLYKESTKTIDLDTFDFRVLTHFPSLKRIYIATEIEGPILVSLLAQIPSSISTIVVSISENPGREWETLGPRFLYELGFFDSVMIPWKDFKERHYRLEEDPLDDRGEITASRDLLMWSFAREAKEKFNSAYLYAAFRPDYYPKRNKEL
ncbi:hypothetical protein DL96DRAFT_1595411 [Flagelloscypha sp. PMI_526]|nr:hypothetical protein DL96DRAFT_1595411 [Flagelloscypha sp. PMI_526]